MTKTDEKPEKPSRKGIGGRPSKFSDDKEDAVVECIRDGGTLNDAANAAGVDVATLKRWLADESRVEFRARYARAREDQADSFADEIVTVARDKMRDPQQARLLVDSLKWVAAKRKPKAYGDKLELAGNAESPLTVNVVTHFKEGA